MADLYNWVLYTIYDLVYNKPPSGSSYGYRWQPPNQGVPNALTTYLKGAVIPPGLYVTFFGTALDPATDFFGRAAGYGPVFAQPGAVSAALSNLVASVAPVPPTGEENWWRYPTQNRLLDVDGYLSYVALCLGFIYQTAPGRQLLDDLTNNAVLPVFVRPGTGNWTRGGGTAAVTTLTSGLSRYKRRDIAIPSGIIDAAVQATYGGNGPAQYNQLAQDMNQAPLYTCFDTAPNFQPAYLGNNFQYQGAPLTGAELQTWVMGGNPGLEAALRGMWQRGPDGVIPLEFFLLALGMTLLPGALPGQGNGASVEFSTQNTGINDTNNLGFRPPAVGLAHELIHAWHYTRGLSPGYDSRYYDTTAAELKFTGIGPYANIAVTENAVRAQWHVVANLDRSNTWVIPAPPRAVYEPLLPNQTFAEARKAYQCI